MPNPDSVLGNKTHGLIWDFKIQTDHHFSDIQPDNLIITKKENLLTCGLCCLGWQQSEVARNLWNMKVTITLIVIGTLGTDTKGLVQRQEGIEITGRVEIIQTTALLKSARKLRRVLET